MAEDRWREHIENAVWEALEAGASPDDIKAEVEYVLENADD